MYQLFFTGDVVLADGCAKKELLSDRLADIVNQCDIVCCNYEAPTGSAMKKQKKKGPNIQNAAATVSILKNAGFNLAACANNHIFDYGIEGMKSTFSLLHQAGIETVGAGLKRSDVVRPFIFEKEQYRIGILNFAENGFGCCVDAEDTYGYAYIFDERLKERFDRLKESCDVIFIVCHAGAENWNIPLPEWRRVYRQFIDWGGAAVIAHHPHTAQGYEEYNGKPIFYSLGNFAFDLGKGAVQPESYCVLFSIEDDGLSYEVIPAVFKNGMVDLQDDEHFHAYLAECCRILSNEEKYQKAVNRKCLDSYKYYQSLYRKVVCIYRGNFMERIKGVIKKYILREKFQDIWLYHNLSVETHLYICKRAVRLIMKRQGIL